MTGSRGGQGWLALALALSAGLALLAHAAVIDGVPRSVGVLVSLVPLVLLVLILTRRAGRRAALLGLLALAAALAMAAWRSWDALEAHFPDLLFVQHAGANLALAVVFGRTLAARDNALVTRFAHVMHASLPPEVVRYTWRVTLAWTVFFSVLFVASCALYFGGFLAAWSLLANLLSPILIGAMFVVEYVVRLRALPHWERIGILGSIRACSRHFRQARLEAPR